MRPPALNECPSATSPRRHEETLRPHIATSPSLTGRSSLRGIDLDRLAADLLTSAAAAAQLHLEISAARRLTAASPVVGGRRS